MNKFDEKAGTRKMEAVKPEDNKEAPKTLEKSPTMVENLLSTIKRAAINISQMPLTIKIFGNKTDQGEKLNQGKTGQESHNPEQLMAESPYGEESQGGTDMNNAETLLFEAHQKRAAAGTSQQHANTDCYHSNEKEESSEWLELIKDHEFLPGLNQHKFDISDLKAMPYQNDGIEILILNKMFSELKERLPKDIMQKPIGVICDAINHMTTEGGDFIDTKSSKLERKRFPYALGQILWSVKEALGAQGFSAWITIPDEENPAKENIVVAGSVDRDWEIQKKEDFVKWFVGNYNFPIKFDATTIFESKYSSIVGTALASLEALDPSGKEQGTYLKMDDVHGKDIPYKIQRNTRVFTEGDKIDDNGDLIEAGKKTIGPFVAIPFIFDMNGKKVKVIIQFFNEVYNKDIGNIIKEEPEFVHWDAGKRSAYLMEKNQMRPFRHRDVLGIMKVLYDLGPSVCAFFEECVTPDVVKNIQTIRDAKRTNTSLRYEIQSHKSGALKMLGALISETQFLADIETLEKYVHQIEPASIRPLIIGIISNIRQMVTESTANGEKMIRMSLEINRLNGILKELETNENKDHELVTQAFAHQDPNNTLKG